MIKRGVGLFRGKPHALKRFHRGSGNEHDQEIRQSKLIDERFKLAFLQGVMRHLPMHAMVVSEKKGPFVHLRLLSSTCR